MPKPQNLSKIIEEMERGKRGESKNGIACKIYRRKIFRHGVEAAEAAVWGGGKGGERGEGKRVGAAPNLFPNK